jgi:1,4-dihydroxy-2-naphthoate octaprenyltransferase
MDKRIILLGTNHLITYWKRAMFFACVMYVITIYTLSASLVFVVLLLHVTAKIIKNTNWMSGFRRWAEMRVTMFNNHVRPKGV